MVKTVLKVIKLQHLNKVFSFANEFSFFVFECELTKYEQIRLEMIVCKLSKD